MMNSASLLTLIVLGFAVVVSFAQVQRWRRVKKERGTRAERLEALCRRPMRMVDRQVMDVRP